MNKIELRRYLKNERQKQNTLIQKENNSLIFSLLKDLKLENFYSTFGSYFAVQGEVHTSSSILHYRNLGKTIYLPQLQNNILSFSQFNKDTPLIDNQFEIPEPTPSSPQILANELDCVFVPLVAFDDNGNRLGQGSAYYDKTFNFLKKLPGKPVLIGLAFEFQHVSSLEKNDWDIPLDACITEKTCYRFSSVLPF